MAHRQSSSSVPRSGTLAFGYRIRVQHNDDPVPWERRDVPTLFLPEGQLPVEWSEIQQDPTVKVAILFRSGKRIDTYIRP